MQADEVEAGAKRQRLEDGTVAAETEHVEVRLLVGGASTRPRLRVPLAGEHELPVAKAALQFAYTGHLPADCSVQQLLELRRQAQYLQVAGCAEACVRQLGELAQACSAPGAEQLQNTDQTELGSFAAQCLFAAANAKHAVHNSPAGAELLAALKPELVQHFGDTLTVLNTPALREQFLQLSVAGVAALLESDGFGTDCESSVLLLLQTWMQGNFSCTIAKERSQLCGHVRLTQLSKPYLQDVLRALAADSERLPGQRAGWFAISSTEAHHLHCLHGCTGKERERRQRAWLKVTGALKHPAWYSEKPRRQCLPAEGRRVEWSISEEELRSKLGGLVEGQAAINDADKELYAAGFSWKPLVRYKHGDSSAGLYLLCDLPSAYSPSGSTVAAACKACVVPVSARLSVSRYGIGNGARGKDVVRSYSPTVAFSPVGRGWGSRSLLPLLPAGATGPLSLERWAEWLKDGKLSGSLTWLPEEDSESE
jgi:hypothetical protein